MTSRSVPAFPRTVALPDGPRVCIRPIAPDDKERVLQGLRSISMRTSQRRFFTPSFYPSAEQLKYLTEVDFDHHVALGAVDCDREGEPGIGAARYVRLQEAPEIAEAAVLVIDAYQQQGVGSLLLAGLNRYAAAQGVERFRAYVMDENREVLEYLRRLGALREEAHDGVVEVDLPVYPTPDALPDRPGLDRVRWAWDAFDRAVVGGC